MSFMTCRGSGKSYMPHVLGSGKSYIPSALNTLCLRYLRYLTQPEAEEEAEAEAEAEAETEAAGA
jgi:hypothetical protein